MRPGRGFRTLTPLGWLGLLWVYSSLFWVLGTLGAVTSGWAEGAAAMGLRLTGTLALGIGLCAEERWAWASAVCLTVLYGALAAGAGALALWTLLTLPAGTLSWMPVFFGLTRGPTLRLAAACGLVAGVSFGALLLLWRGQGRFDVPHRRSYTALRRQGLLPALGILLLDLYLAWSCWLHQVR